MLISISVYFYQYFLLDTNNLKIFDAAICQTTGFQTVFRNWRHLQTTNRMQLNSLPNDNILDWSKFKAFADDKINVTKNNEIYFGKGRKHCGKRKKCWLPAFSPFPTMFSKGSFFRVVKSQDCVGKLILYHTIPASLNDPETDRVWKHYGKWRKCWQPDFFLPFSHNVFYPIKKRNNHFSNIKIVVCR